MKQIVILVLMFSFLACNTVEKPEKPDDLLSKDEMVNILYDVYIINAAKGSSKIVLENNGIYPEKYVFQKHDIDSLRFAKSNAYYGFYVDEYESIITKVEDRLAKNKDKIQAKIDEEKKEKQQKRDSIKKLNDSLKPKSIKSLDPIQKKKPKNYSKDSIK